MPGSKSLPGETRNNQPETTRVKPGFRGVIQKECQHGGPFCLFLFLVYATRNTRNWSPRSGGVRDWRPDDLKVEGPFRPISYPDDQQRAGELLLRRKPCPAGIQKNSTPVGRRISRGIPEKNPGLRSFLAPHSLKHFEGLRLGYERWVSMVCSRPMSSLHSGCGHLPGMTDGCKGEASDFLLVAPNSFS